MTEEERAKKIRELALEQSGHRVEIDADALVSEGDDNGAYVACWMWVDFASTEFDKGEDDEDEYND